MELITVREIANKLECSRQNVHRIINRWDIKPVTRTNGLLFDNMGFIKIKKHRKNLHKPVKPKKKTTPKEPKKEEKPVKEEKPKRQWGGFLRYGS